MPQSRLMIRRPEGFSLIELLVLIAVLLLLIGLLLPAIQKAREAAQRAGCMNNLHNLGVALHNYETAHRELPPGGVDIQDANGDWKDAHSWATFLLPYLEQQALYNRYHWEKRWYQSVNRDVVSTHLRIMQCPSAEPDRMAEGFIGWQAAAGDYGVLNSIHPKLRKDGLIENVPNLEGAMWVVGEKHSVSARMADLSDGASCTIVIAEDAGRPDVWRRDGLASGNVTGAGWADRENAFELSGSSSDGKTPYGECAVNCTNANEVFSFHPGGAHVLFADGSVHFIHEEIPIRVLAALVTRTGGEIVSFKDYAE